MPADRRGNVFKSRLIAPKWICLCPRREDVCRNGGATPVTLILSP